MGSYNETCMLTQAPIKSGDEVIIYILTVNKGLKRSNTIIQPNHLYQPISFGIRAKYDDGYLFYDIQDEEFHKQYLNSFFEIEKLPELLDDIISDKLGESYKVVTMLASVHDKVIEHFKTRNIPYEKNWTPDFERDAEKVFTLKEVLYEERFDLLLFRGLDDYHNIMNEEFNRMDSIYKELIQVIKKAYDEKNIHSFSSYIKDLLYINTILKQSRKIWHPQAGRGNSSDEIALHLVMAQELFNIFEKRKEEEKTHEKNPKKIKKHHEFVESLYAHVPKARFEQKEIKHHGI